MRCSRGDAKLLKFARAAIFTPDMTNSGAVLLRARGTTANQQMGQLWICGTVPRTYRTRARAISVKNVGERFP